MEIKQRKEGRLHGGMDEIFKKERTCIIVEKMDMVLRVLYIAGDMALYYSLLKYELRNKKPMLFLGILCLLLFIIKPEISMRYLYGEWLYYILMVIGSVLLFERLQVGLVFLVFTARLMGVNLLSGCAITFFHADLLVWKAEGIFDACINIGTLAIILLLSFLCNKKEELHQFIAENKGWIFLLGGVLLLIPATTVYYGTPTEDNLHLAEAISMVKDGLLGFVLLGLLISIMINMAQKRNLKEQIRHNMRCIEEQTKQYQEIHEKQQALRSFRHDLNGHMIALRGYADMEDLEGIREYLNSMNSMKEDTSYLSTGNVIGDSIFGHYKNECEKQDVEFWIKGTFGNYPNVAETDLCIILSNMVSNAYDAALQCEDERYIHVEIIQTENERTLITIENTVKKLPDLNNGKMRTTKKKKEFHGLGIENAQKAIQKYGGFVQWEGEAHRMVTNIYF